MFAIKDVVGNLYRYDINGDGSVNYLDSSAWDSIEEYYQLGLTLTEAEIKQANLTGDVDDFLRKDIVNESDILRYLAASGSWFGRTWNPTDMKAFLEYDFVKDDTFQSYDVNRDGVVSVKDLARIRDAITATGIMTVTFSAFIYDVYGMEYADDIMLHMDEVESVIRGDGAYSEDLYHRADINKDGVVDRDDLAMYSRLYVDSEAGMVDPFGGVTDVYIGELAKYVAGTFTTDSLNLWYKLNLASQMNLDNILFMTDKAADFSGPIADQEAWMQKVMDLSFMADLVQDSKLSLADFIKMQDTIESEGLRRDLGFSKRADVFAIDTDGYMKYDVNKDGSLDYQDMIDLRNAFNNFTRFDIAHYKNVELAPVAAATIEIRGITYSYEYTTASGGTWTLTDTRSFAVDGAKSSVSVAGIPYSSEYTTADGGTWTLLDAAQARLMKDRRDFNLSGMTYRGEYTTAGGGTWKIKNIGGTETVEVTGTDTEVVLGGEHYRVTAGTDSIILRHIDRTIKASDSEAVFDGQVFDIVTDGALLTFKGKTYAIVKDDETAVIGSRTFELVFKDGKVVIHSAGALTSGRGVDKNGEPVVEIDEADLELMDIASKYKYLENSISEAELKAANISGNVDAKGVPIITEEDYNLMAGVIQYAKDVNSDRKYMALADPNDFTMITTIVKNGGMNKGDVVLAGLSRLDMNGDGAITNADLTVATGGFDAKDVECVKAAYELVSKYGFTFEDIRSADANFDGVIDQKDAKIFKENAKGGFDLNRDGRIDSDDLFIIDQMRTILYQGAIMPTAWIIAGDINRDGVVNSKDAKDLKDSIDYRKDINLDGKIDYRDVFLVSNVIEAGRLGFKPEDVIASDLNKDSWLDEKDVSILTDIVLNLNKYDLNQDGVLNGLDTLVIYNLLGGEPSAIVKSYADSAVSLLADVQSATSKRNANSLLAIIKDIRQTADGVRENIRNIVDSMSEKQTKYIRMLQSVEEEMVRLDGIVAEAETIVTGMAEDIETDLSKVKAFRDFAISLKEMAEGLSMPYRPQEAKDVAKKALIEAQTIAALINLTDKPAADA
ncbi:MAG: dockerin type I domain-containing protein, partial [Candidatus Omnitrophota bacterium]